MLHNLFSRFDGCQQRKPGCVAQEAEWAPAACTCWCGGGVMSGWLWSRELQHLCRSPPKLRPMRQCTGAAPNEAPTQRPRPLSWLLERSATAQTCSRPSTRPCSSHAPTVYHALVLAADGQLPSLAPRPGSMEHPRSAQPNMPQLPAGLLACLPRPATSRRPTCRQMLLLLNCLLQTTIATPMQCPATWRP